MDGALIVEYGRRDDEDVDGLVDGGNGTEARAGVRDDDKACDENSEERPIVDCALGRREKSWASDGRCDGNANVSMSFP